LPCGVGAVAMLFISNVVYRGLRKMTPRRALIPVSKVIEKVFLNRLDLYFESNNLLTEKQHDFRKKKSTITALFDCVSEIYDSVENRGKS
jgi:uncharacterized protein YoxC